MYENKVYYGLKYEPRDIQKECLNFTKFHINRGKKFILLNLPTGSGKSFYSVMFMNWYLNYINDEARFDILTNSKLLQNQYTKEFNFISSLKGKNSYMCDTWKCSCQEGKEMNKAMKKTCSDCPYDKAFQGWMTRKVTLTNFHLFDTLHLYLSGFLNEKKQQNVLIIDEAHDFESVLCDFITMKISSRSLKLLGFNDSNLAFIYQQMKDIKNIRQYKAFIGDFFIDYLSEHCDKLEDRLSNTSLPQGERIKMSKNITSIQTSIETLKNFIRDIEEDEVNINNWVLDVEKIDYPSFPISFIAQPVWSYNYLEKLIWKRYDHVIFMSGTLLNKDLISYTNGLDNNLCCYYDSPSPFNVKNRPIYYIKNIGKMTYEEKQNTWLNQKVMITKLLKKYSNVKGIIHTSNYEIAKWVEEEFKDNSRFIFHTSENRDEALQRHINSIEPTILVSPSMISGVDLKDDLSRFQIILKIPYPSIQSNKIKKRQSDNKEWYIWKTVVDLIQEYGRSIRNENDHADTFILDDSFSNIMKFHHQYLPHYFTEAIKVFEFKQ